MGSGHVHGVWGVITAVVRQGSWQPSKGARIRATAKLRREGGGVSIIGQNLGDFGGGWRVRRGRAGLSGEGWGRLRG